MRPINAILTSLLVMSTAAIAQSPSALLVMLPAPPEQPVFIAEAPQDSEQAERAEAKKQRAEAKKERGSAEAEQAEAQKERLNVEAERRESRRPPTEEEALALAAMEGLMSQPPQRALPIIKKVMAGSQSTLVKQRALFVLSQMDVPEAQAVLLETAKSGDIALRREAIRNIGIGGNAKSLAGLQDIYSAGDAKVKSNVLEAWLIAGRKAEVYQAALNAKSDEEAKNAIRMLSVMGAVEELRKLGDLQKHGKSLLEAYAISGDLTSLRKIADGNGDVSVRGEAVQRIGIVGTDAARTALRDIYTANATSNPKLRDAALHGMLISGDQQGVLTLYRAAKTTEEKRVLLRTLSIMGGDAALQAIDAALESKK
jgi:HEAT repeat protein